MKLNPFTRLFPLVAVTLTLSVTSVAPAQPAKTQHLSSPDQVPKGLSTPDWTSIRQQYEQHRHAAVPVAGAPETFQARNPGQQWQTRFDGGGFVTRPDTGGWQRGLKLRNHDYPATNCFGA